MKPMVGSSVPLLPTMEEINSTRDEFSEKLLKAIEAKAKGKGSTFKPMKVVHTSTTEDLMQKLKDSLKPTRKKAS